MNQNITSLIRDMFTSGHNYGFLLKQLQEITYYNSIIFYSPYTYSTGPTTTPKLVIKYTTNYPPAFVGGTVQSITICEDTSSVSLNSLLQVVDSNVGLTETWSVISGPTHGTLATSYTTTTTGGLLTPVGLSFIPDTGFSGTDSFSVKVSNGYSADTTKIIVTINSLPYTSIISGPSAMCIDTTRTFTDSILGGTWGTSNSHALITSAGIVAGISSGWDTIKYSVSNSCGTSVATKKVFIYTPHQCDSILSVDQTGNEQSVLNLFPNPSGNELTIEFTGNSNISIGSVQFINEFGQIILDQYVLGNKTNLDISNLPAGVYWIRIYNHNTLVTKILVKK